MQNKPTVAAGYSPAAVQLVKRASLYIATKLGDLRDDVVIVGGLVSQPACAAVSASSGKVAAHWHDGRAIAILDQQRYHELCVRLRNAGFTPDINDAGRAWFNGG